MGGFWLTARGIVYPLLPDSTAYLEMSRSFLHHGRFEVVPWALTQPTVVTAPTALWPPLFPLAIALLSKIGVADIVAAPLINRACFALLPALLLWALSGTASPRRLIAAGALALTSPGVMAAQYFGLSEGLGALLLVSAVGFALRTERPTMLLLSGLCGGASYVTRNPALAVCAAIPLWLLLDSPRRADAPRRIVLWAVGAAVAIAPLWLYNIRVFGKVQPYAAEASTTGVLQNIRMLAASTAGEVIGARGADRWLTPPVPSVVAAVVLLIIVVGIWRSRRSDAPSGRAVRLLLLVVVAMSGLLIVAASRYQFQGLNEHRFVVLYLWALFAALAIALPEGNSGEGRHRLMLVVLVLLFSARGYDSWRRIGHRTDGGDGAIALAGDQALRAYLEQVRQPAPFVASNGSWILRAEVGSPIRQLLYCPDYADQLTQLNALAAAGRTVEVIITTQVSGQFCEADWARALQDSGFTIARTTPRSVVYRKAPPAPSAGS